MKKLLPALLVFTPALVLVESGAHAFAFENNSTSNSNGSGLVDPDQQVRNSSNGSTNGQQGSSGFHFSVGPANGLGQANRFSSPPSWVSNPLFLDKGSSQSDQ